MAQWNRTDRTLYAKLVYYGPALGGKTTNLQALHRLTDPEGRQALVAINTADDRTLFFDLLPFELGTVFGYKVAMKLYTVPGQVRYDATRRIVLAGADSVVFVADSSPGREADNRQAWENLRLNMRANRLDPASVPCVVQLNKRDVPGALPVADLERLLGVPAGHAFPAVATAGDGVLETFVAASEAMLERLVAFSEPASRRALEAGGLKGQVQRAFAPHLARHRGPVAAAAPPSDPPIVAADPSNLLESAVASGVELGARLADERGRASRLEHEATALRQLSDALRATGADFDRASVVGAALSAARRVLGAASAAFVAAGENGRPEAERTDGRSLAPLFGDPRGAALIGRMIATEAAAVVDDVAPELAASPAAAVAGLRALAVVPVEGSARTALLAAMPSPDGRLDASDVRFLDTLAGHLASGLDRVRIHEELRAHRDQLEATVRARTRALRKAYADLKTAEATKDRFLSNVSHEMRTPLTAIIGAATFLKEYDGERADREEMAVTVLNAAAALEQKVDGLLRVAQLDASRSPATAPTPVEDLLAEALRLAGEPDGVRARVDPDLPAAQVEFARLARALANLVDNARKFGPPGSEVEILAAPCTLARAGGEIPGISFSVLDRGPGLPEGEVERAFEPFEQGGDPLTEKPSGVGLGLYEARTIVHGHGGTLTYAPRAGGGSEFRISVPAAPAAVPEARRA